MYTKVRQILPEKTEIGFILKTWGREHYKTMPRQFPQRLFFTEFGAIMAELAKRAKCAVASNPDDINQIQGFAIGKVAEDGVFLLHFVYVRPEFRRMGLCREMCAYLGYDETKHELVATHWSDYASKIDRKGKPIIYHPYILYGLRGDK